MCNKIREIANKKNIRISHIISSTKLSKSFVYEVINGTSIPTVPSARLIAKSLNATLDEVFPDN